MNPMVPELHKILYGEVKTIQKKEGRIINLLSGYETKIQVGTLQERVVAYLAAEGSAKPSEISRGIDATLRKTRLILKELVATGVVVEISIDGLPPEYSLSVFDRNQRNKP